MKRLALILLLTVGSVYAGDLDPQASIMRYMHEVGRFDGAGHLRMKPGFSLHSEIQYYVDDCGYVRAVRHYYLDYRGRRFTD